LFNALIISNLCKGYKFYLFYRNKLFSPLALNLWVHHSFQQEIVCHVGRHPITNHSTLMKNAIMIAFGLLLTISQASFAQAVQEAKAARKEMKAEKKMAKAHEKRVEAKTHKGIEIAGVSDPKTRMKDANRKEEKAEKKEMKAQADMMKAGAKAEKKKAAKID
jgi:C4-dicarboxylate-specific signal transduction histidine kinase